MLLAEPLPLSDHPPPPAPAPVPLVRIRPSSGWAALNLRDVWTFRDLLVALAARDVKLRYRQTALGVAWVVLQPLLGAGILTFVFGTIAKLPAPDGVPGYLFVLAGMLAWNVFSTTLTKAGTCLVGNAQLVSKVYFPRLVLPLSTVLSALIDFAVGGVCLAVLMAVKGVAPGWPVVLLPVWLGLMVCLAVGIGLYAAGLTVSYRDVQYVLPVAIQMLLYASPVAYSVTVALDRLPAGARRWFLLNPLAGLLDAFRWSALGGRPPHWPAVGWAAGVSVAVLGAGLFAFRRMERRFADVI